jgi:hypothetical protein
MRSIRQQGLAIGLGCIPHNARARNSRKRWDGSHARCIPRVGMLASAPFRPSGLRGETVSLF